MDIDNFTRDLAFLREKRHIVQDSEVVAATGISKGNVSQYLNGKLKPSKNFLQKFYEFYGKFLKDRTDQVAEEQAEYGDTTTSLRKENAHLKKEIENLERIINSKDDLIRAKDDIINTLKTALVLVGEKAEMR